MKEGEGGSVGVDGRGGGCGELDGRQVDHRRDSLVVAGSGEEGAGKGDLG